MEAITLPKPVVISVIVSVHPRPKVTPIKSTVTRRASAAWTLNLMMSRIKRAIKIQNIPTIHPADINNFPLFLNLKQFIDVLNIVKKFLPTLLSFYP